MDESEREQLKAAAYEIQEKYKRDWRAFNRDIYGDPVLWEKQREIWDSVSNRQRTLVVSGHAAGKDWLSGHIGPWFAHCWVPSIVITTAPTDRQVEKVLWGEIHSAAAQATQNGTPLGGKLLTQEWQLGPKHYAIGFTTKDYAAHSSKFAGFHEASVLIILSEFAGIPQSIVDSVEGVSTGEHVRLLATTQPAPGPGPFAKAIKYGCRKGPECRCRKWHIITVTSWEAAEAREKYGIKALASREWCQDRLEQWGEDSPLYKIRVMAETPDVSTDTVIPLSWAERSMKLDLSTEGKAGVGVDVARFGEDDSVISVVRGKRVTRKEKVHGQDTTVISGLTLKVLREEGLKVVAIDDGGVGGGVVDQVKRDGAGQGIHVIPINFGARARKDEDYVDKSAEMWWELREDLRLGQFQLPVDDEMLAGMTARKYELPKGKIKLESKESMKKRGVASPDDTDSILLAREAQVRGTEIGLAFVGVDSDSGSATADDVNWKDV